MPVDEYEISSHTGQRFRSRGWNNGVGFRLCIQLLPGVCTRPTIKTRVVSGDLDLFRRSSHLFLARMCWSFFATEV